MTKTLINVKLNESVGKSLAEIYKDELKAFGPALVRENPH